MPKMSVNILFQPDDLIRAFNLMPMRQKIKMVQTLEKETIGSRIDGLLERCDRRRGKKKFSQKEIDHEVREARKAIYG